MPTIPKTIRPKAGWLPVIVTDLRLTGATGECEKCGKTGLRFVHLVEHDNGNRLNVGCECARHLCFDYVPEREEARLRSRFDKRSRWLTRDWRTSRNGNPTLKFRYEGELVRVTIFRPSFALARFSFSISSGGNVFFSSITFATADAAKLGAFDELAELCEW